MNASPRARVAALDWPRISHDLDANGYALTGAILAPEECAALVALYPERERFRSRVDMARLRYGVGEYKYFARPMPKIVRGASHRALSAPRAGRKSMEQAAR